MSDYLSCCPGCCHTLSQNPPASRTFSGDLWQAASCEVANCRTEKHLPRYQLIFPAPPPPLCIIGKEHRFYEEMTLF